MEKLFQSEVSLVLAVEEDAEFILSLRLDKDLSKHISNTKPDLESQKKWLLDYKKRESDRLEFYFIIYLRKEKVGTIRIYDIDYKNKTCTWGSFIIKRNVSRVSGNPRVSVISLFLIFNFIFEELQIEDVKFDVRKENKRVREFYLGFAKITHEDKIDTFLHLSKQDYCNTFLSKFNEFLF